MKVKLTAGFDLRVYLQGLPIPNQLRIEVLIDKVPMQYYGFVILLSNYNYRNRSFEQLKPSGKRRTANDLTRVNQILRSDYKDNNSYFRT